MDIDVVLQAANSLLATWTKDTKTPEPNRLDVTVALADLLPAITALAESRWGYLAAITGLDLGAKAGELEALYQFCAGAAVVTLRVRIPRADASIPSICGIIPSASFFERELSEMFGITIVGTPDPNRLFLPDNWPEGVYPLRKDFAPDAVTA